MERCAQSKISIAHMKIGKNLSLVSIIVMIILLAIKISYDIKIYNEFMLQKNANQGFASASYIIPKYYFSIIIISIIISIIGYIKKNKFENYGTIEIFGTGGGLRYFGRLKLSKYIKSLIRCEKVRKTNKIYMIHEWIEYDDRFYKTEWYKAEEKLSVSDSWGRQPKILKAYISDNSLISFKTDFKELKPNCTQAKETSD